LFVQKIIPSGILPVWVVPSVGTSAGNQKGTTLMTDIDSTGGKHPLSDEPGAGFIRFSFHDMPMKQAAFGELPIVERERRIRNVIYGWPGNKPRWERIKRESHSHYVSGDNEFKIQQELIDYWNSNQNYVMGTCEQSDYQVQLNNDPVTMVSTMLYLGILPFPLTTYDIDTFFAERACLARWEGLDHLSEVNKVNILAPIWWKRYIAHPTDNHLHYNVSIHSGLMIRAKLLPENFTSRDLINFMVERCYVSSTLELMRSDFPGDSRYWELTNEGIEAAEQMGLRNPEPDATKKPVPASTRKIIKTDNKPVNRSGFCSIADLIARNTIPDHKKQSFEKAVHRWRHCNEGSSDFLPHDAPSKNQARYLYREAAGAIQDIIKKYQENS
jgi:hypothetical protein